MQHLKSLFLLGLFLGTLGSLLAVPPDLPCINETPALFGTDVTTPDYNVFRPVHVDANGAIAVTGSTGGSDPKAGQPTFFVASLASTSATLFSTIVTTVATDSEYIISFVGAVVVGPASTTAAAVKTTGTLFTDEKLSIKPGTALNIGLIGNTGLATATVMKFPLVTP
jgi:hypothetical protein